MSSFISVGKLEFRPHKNGSVLGFIKILKTDRQCTYSAALRRVRVTIVAVEKTVSINLLAAELFF